MKRTTATWSQRQEHESLDRHGTRDLLFDRLCHSFGSITDNSDIIHFWCILGQGVLADNGLGPDQTVQAAHEIEQ